MIYAVSSFYFASFLMSVYLVSRSFPRSVVNNIGLFYIFTSSMYVFSVILDYFANNLNYGDEHVLGYLAYAAPSILMFSLGFSACNNRMKISNILTHTVKQRNKYLFTFLIASSVILIYYRLSSVEFNLDYFVKVYRSEEGIDYSINIIEKIAPFLFSVIACALIISYGSISKKLKFILLFLIFITSIAYLLRGNRNIFLFIMLPQFLAYLYVKRYRLSDSKWMLLFVLGFFFAEIVDVIRAIGLQDFVLSDLAHHGGRFTSGEFGTGIRIWRTYMDNQFHSDYLYGESYLLYPLLNLLATFGLNFTTMAAEFSEYIPGGVFGMGWNPYLEAYVNFWYFGILVFFIFGYILKFISILLLRSRSLQSKVMYFMLFPLILNFQRIDFSVVIKVGLIVYLCSFILNISIGRYNNLHSTTLLPKGDNLNSKF